MKTEDDSGAAPDTTTSGDVEATRSKQDETMKIEPASGSDAPTLPQEKEANPPSPASKPDNDNTNIPLEDLAPKNDSQSSVPAKRKRVWGKPATSTPVQLSTETIKALLPMDRPSSSKRPKTVNENNSSPSVEKTETTTVTTATVSPPKNPFSNTLFIEGFVRPLMVKAVKDLLSQYGTVDFIWMNVIKSQCYVIFAKEEESIACREAIHNLEWKQGKLQADFSTSEVAHQIASRTPGAPGSTQAGSTKTSSSRSTNAAPAPAAPPQVSTTTEQISTAPQRMVVDDKKVVEPPPIPHKVEEPPPPAVTLDTLFKKTRSRPVIYYLPLTDTQVAEKKKTASTTASKTTTAPQNSGH
ncbi:Apoptotic chromatin condensation inducer in the nucleus [Pelomyxa schiedti]|nr:Apoptotic chromatin condensation inducer in the nucleus [Pelomyxa schiedti]